MANSADTVRAVPSFVYELAHKIRVTLATEEVRRKVTSIVFDTIKAQNTLFQTDSVANAKARVKHIAWPKNGGVGEKPQWPGDNRGLAVYATDWPFPLEHGKDVSPGCVLILASLNDYAAENPRLFLKAGCEFTPLEPFGKGGEGNTGAWCLYGSRWVDAVKKLETEHEKELRAVLESALSELGLENGSPRIDYQDYVSASDIRTQHTPDGIVLDHRNLKAFLKVHPDIRTARPPGKDGKPRENRLIVHLADWHKNREALVEWYESDSDTIETPSVKEVERRQAAVRSTKQRRK